MTLRPCCGKLPEFTSTSVNGIGTVQILCGCGSGATVLFTKPEQRAETEQAVIDGWNREDGAENIPSDCTHIRLTS